jgi:hypothetical protein
MPRILTCPACKASTTIPDDSQAKMVFCWQCAGSIPVPAQAQAAPPAKSDRLQAPSGNVPPPAPTVDWVPRPEVSTGLRREPAIRASRSGTLLILIGLGLGGLFLLGCIVLAVFLLALKPSSESFAVSAALATASKSPELPAVKEDLPPPPMPDPAPPPVKEDPAPVAGQPEPIRPVTLAGPGISRDWQVLFRAHDPNLWDRDVNKGEQQYSRPIGIVADDVRWLRVRRHSDYVIIAMTRDRLRQLDDESRTIGWNGTSRLAEGARHLGVYDRRLDKFFEEGVACINEDLSGWGFGAIRGVGNRQGYCWAGKNIGPTVLEIAVKPGELTDQERENLLPKPLKGAAINPAKLEGAGISKDWQVIFCSADPAIWNQDVNRGVNHFARPLSGVGDIRWLRLRKDADFVVLPMTRDNLTKSLETGRYRWQGTAYDDCNARHLGISDSQSPSREFGDISIIGFPHDHRGWGFGHRFFKDDEQGYTWDGKVIAPIVFEIAVKPGTLTEAETRKLLHNEKK